MFMYCKYSIFLNKCIEIKDYWYVYFWQSTLKFSLFSLVSQTQINGYTNHNKDIVSLHQHVGLSTVLGQSEQWVAREVKRRSHV